MQKIFSVKSVSLAVVIFGMLTVAPIIFAQQSLSAQTSPATNIQDTQATLNGYLTNLSSYNGMAWFQWGTSTSYGNTTPTQTLNFSGPFSQAITSLTPNTTYHYRAVSQDTQQTVYGQDLTFTTNSSSGTTGGTNTTGNLTVAKKVINLTQNNLTWGTSINANAGDILSFAVTLQAGNQDIHNAVIKDNLPSGLTYKGNLTVNANIDNQQNPMSGINVGTIPANQIAVVAYQVQVNANQTGASLTNSVTVTSTEGGTQTASASVTPGTSNIPPTTGPTDVETGLTNYFFSDSLLAPLLIIFLAMWIYFSGTAYAFADLLKKKK
jgi:hypothetical protein